MKPAGAGPEQRRPDGMPQGTPWTAGKSGNPEGVSAYQAKLRRAIEKRETVERVLDVIDAMRVDAMAHEKYSPSAAKVYLGAVGINVTSPPVKLDLTDAPDEVVAYLAEKLPQ